MRHRGVQAIFTLCNTLQHTINELQRSRRSKCLAYALLRHIKPERSGVCRQQPCSFHVYARSDMCICVCVCVYSVVSRWASVRVRVHPPHRNMCPPPRPSQLPNTNTKLHAHAYTCMCTCIRTYARANTHAYTHAHRCAQTTTHMYAQTLTYMRVSLHRHTHVHTCKDGASGCRSSHIQRTGGKVMSHTSVSRFTHMSETRHVTNETVSHHTRVT